MAKPKTQEQFIVDARKIHGDKYGYEKVVYVNGNMPIIIRCPIHGEFPQKAKDHLRSECPDCGKALISTKLTCNTDRFIEKAKKVHGDTYDYSQTEYVHSHTNVLIGCSVHGLFPQLPSNHLRGSICPKCNRENFKLTLEDFVRRSTETHEGKYDYSKVVYVDSKTSVEIICPEHGPFPQIPNSHLSGAGCKKCAGNALKSIQEMASHLLHEFHPTKNTISTDMPIQRDTEVWWICSAGHEWEEAIITRCQREAGCPHCRKLDLTHPTLAQQWHPTKNGNLTPHDVTYGSKIVAWWQCDRNVDHAWDCPISSRTDGNEIVTGCPFCSGKRVHVSNCLATTNPQLASEWHPTKNADLTPHDVTYGSKEMVWWQCPVASDHVYDQTPNTRSICGCPFCRGLRVCLSNCLATTHPHLVKEWHPTKNTFTPYDVVAGSDKYAWWVCDKGPDHEYEALIGNRANLDSGCPCCKGIKVVPSNCLATTNPQLASEWHPTKNGILTPSDVTRGSGKKVWWVCDKGHEFSAAISNRNAVNPRNRGGCPVCGESYGEKQTALVLNKRSVRFKREKWFRSCRNIKPLPFDFLIYHNKRIALIEYQGVQHYEPVAFGSNKPGAAEENLKKVQHHDAIKRKWCKNNGVPLLEIPYWVDDIDILIDEFLNSLVPHKLAEVA